MFQCYPSDLQNPPVWKSFSLAVKLFERLDQVYMLISIQMPMQVFQPSFAILQDLAEFVFLYALLLLGIVFQTPIFLCFVFLSSTGHVYDEGIGSACKSAFWASIDDSFLRRIQFLVSVTPVIRACKLYY